MCYTHSLAREEARLAEGGPLVVDTGRHTGRSPNDRFVVREPGSEERIAWGNVNRPISEDGFVGLRDKVVAQLESGDVYVVDAFAGADPAHRLAVRVVTESAVARTLRAHALHQPERAGARRPPAGCARPPCAVRRGRSRRGRDAQRDVHPAAPDTRRGRDRRDAVRGGDQEVDLRAHERPPSPRGRLPHALLGERRRRGPCGHLLRALGNGQDDALRGSRPSPDRGRRARLERGRRLQLRRRLLRQGDPALAQGGARDLPDDADLRHGARERGRGRARRPRPRRLLEDGEHARRLRARADRETRFLQSAQAIRASSSS